MNAISGIRGRRIRETPIAIIDFETTGLSAGADRVVEVSVVRVDPGDEPVLSFDTLVNPARPMAATEIHGITDDDVANAPRFTEIAGELVRTLQGCVIAAYNVYFDIKFLEYEMNNAGITRTPPHFCLMYMRPLLGIGSRCRLEEACRDLDVIYPANHVASNDAMASGKLLLRYLDIAKQKGIRTFDDLTRTKSYKYFQSFDLAPLPGPAEFGLSGCTRLCSRSGLEKPVTIEPKRQGLQEYWDALRVAVADLEITDDELDNMIHIRKEYNLKPEKVRSLHARVFASVIAQFCDDHELDDRETHKLKRLHKCLSRLGWAPGE
ncbi:MAG: PolC-type DNA polymerase III [Phycisphaerae bacterium]